MVVLRTIFTFTRSEWQKRSFKGKNEDALGFVREELGGDAIQVFAHFPKIFQAFSSFKLGIVGRRRVHAVDFVPIHQANVEFSRQWKV